MKYYVYIKSGGYNQLGNEVCYWEATDKFKFKKEVKKEYTHRGQRVADILTKDQFFKKYPNDAIRFFEKREK